MQLNTNIQVLIVDDFVTMRRIVKGCLVQMGLSKENFIEAEDGQEAFEKLKDSDVDLIISDWNMPNMTGLELLKAVRADEELKNIPFMLVTAEGLKEYVLEAINAGVTQYIVKPFSPEFFQEKIKTVLEK